jgi:transcriptional regulator with XRE-family HTH domain
MRQSLGATVAQLAKASGVPYPSIEAIEAIEAIERGGAATLQSSATSRLRWLGCQPTAQPSL